MTELIIVQENLSVFDTVEISPEARTEYEGGEFEAIFPKNAKTKTYVFSMYTFNNSTVEIADNSMVLGIENGSVLALVPEEKYQ